MKGGRFARLGSSADHLHFPKQWVLPATEAHAQPGFRANPEEASDRLTALGRKVVVSEARPVL